MNNGDAQKWYKDGNTYFSKMGFIDLWKQCTDFKNGRQWPPKTEKTKNLPRPVINFIRFIENHKIAQILSEPLKMIFSPEEVLDSEVEDEETEKTKIGADLFTQFADQEWEDIKQDDLNEEALDKAAELGAGIYHYYFDDSIVKGKKSIVKGAMRGEILHPSCVMVGNPQCLDTQLQPYILVPVRDDVDNIRSRAKANGVGIDSLQQIKGDKDIKDTSDNAKFEVKEKATEITCYYKQDGFVWLMKICGEVITKQSINTQHKLYPIARVNWYKEDKNWYGIGETEGLIANQKAINFITAMQMMAEQLTGMPKLMLKKDYVKSFNNDASTPIMDTNPNGWSAQYLQPAYQSTKGQQLVDFLMSSSKIHSGATETATGEMAQTSRMNATAIMMLQKASSVPIDQIKKRFRRTIEEIGQIWFEFWTINYNTNRIIEIKDIDGMVTTKNFRCSDFKDIGLKLKIDVGASTEYSESIMMASLDKLYDSKAIDVETYVDLAPQNVMPFKEKLKKILERKKEEMMAQQGNIELTPEEQATISKLPPEQQKVVMQQLQGQKPNNSVQTPQM